MTHIYFKLNTFEIFRKRCINLGAHHFPENVTTRHELATRSREGNHVRTERYAVHHVFWKKQSKFQ